MFLHTKDDTDSHGDGDMLHWPLRTSLLSHLAPPPSDTLFIFSSRVSYRTPVWAFADDYICSCNSQTFQTGIVRVQTIGDRRSVDGISGSVGHPLLCDNAGAQWNRWLATLNYAILLYFRVQRSNAYSSHRYTCF